MSKTVSGIMLIGGLLVSSISGAIGSTIGSASDNNLSSDNDLFYNLCGYVSGVGILLGIALFGYGAMMFSRSK